MKPIELEIYNYIDKEIENYEESNQALTETINTNNKQLVILKRIKKQFKENICKFCNGKGKIWHSYTQDETRLEECLNCKGTGIKE